MLTTLLVLPLAAAAGDAVIPPAGTGTLVFKEKISVKGCGSEKGIGFLTFTSNGDETWEASTAIGFLTGFMEPLDTKGRKWLLGFDGGEQATYEGSLEEAAGDICGFPVTLFGFELKKFEVKFDKDFTGMKLKLKSKGFGTSNFGDGKGSHSLKGKGDFQQQAP